MSLPSWINHPMKIVSAGILTACLVGNLRALQCPSFFLLGLHDGGQRDHMLNWEFLFMDMSICPACLIVLCCKIMSHLAEVLASLWLWFMDCMWKLWEYLVCLLWVKSLVTHSSTNMFIDLTVEETKSNRLFKDSKWLSPFPLARLSVYLSPRL